MTDQINGLAFGEALDKASRMFKKGHILSALQITQGAWSWLKKGASPTAEQFERLKELLNPNDGKTRSGAFRFIDLFAGIGGIRQGIEKNGGECVFTSEWNEQAQKTYMANFADGHGVFGDITKIEAQCIPDHDFLAGGFPCQPFSIAGVSKKNSLGRVHGFADKTQGTLFFDVARIIDKKRPAAFLLENVKNLVSHDGGKTFKIILETLQDELGYQVFWKVIDGARFRPQHRERILIAGFREKTSFDFEQVVYPVHGGGTLAEVLHKTDGTEMVDGTFLVSAPIQVNPKYTLTPGLWDYLQRYAQKHKQAGNGFGYGMAYPDSIARTLSARYYKDGSEILIGQGENRNPRRLTPRECARLMGFSDQFKIVASDMQAYKQFGNSVVIPVIEAVTEAMVPHVLKMINGQPPI